MTTGMHGPAADAQPCAVEKRVIGLHGLLLGCEQDQDDGCCRFMEHVGQVFPALEHGMASLPEGVCLKLLALFVHSVDENMPHDRRILAANAHGQSGRKPRGHEPASSGEAVAAAAGAVAAAGSYATAAGTVATDSTSVDPAPGAGLRKRLAVGMLLDFFRLLLGAVMAASASATRLRADVPASIKILCQFLQRNPGHWLEPSASDTAGDADAQGRAAHASAAYSVPPMVAGHWVWPALADVANLWMHDVLLPRRGDMAHEQGAAAEQGSPVPWLGLPSMWPRLPEDELFDGFLPTGGHPVHARHPPHQPHHHQQHEPHRVRASVLAGCCVWFAALPYAAGAHRADWPLHMQSARAAALREADGPARAHPHPHPAWWSLAFTTRATPETFPSLPWSKASDAEACSGQGHAVKVEAPAADGTRAPVEATAVPAGARTSQGKSIESTRTIGHTVFDNAPVPTHTSAPAAATALAEQLDPLATREPSSDDADAAADDDDDVDDEIIVLRPGASATGNNMRAASAAVLWNRHGQQPPSAGAPQNDGGGGASSIAAGVGRSAATSTGNTASALGGVPPCATTAAPPAFVTRSAVPSAPGAVYSASQSAGTSGAAGAGTSSAAAVDAYAWNVASQQGSGWSGFSGALPSVPCTALMQTQAP